MQGYSAPLVVAEALEWLTQKRDPKKPFFMTVWTHEPHYPIKSDPKFKALYPQLKDDIQAEHHANVTQMDSAFGQLMKKLDEEGLRDQTLVFFTSDNGPEGDGVTSPGRGSSGGLRGRKRDMHDGGIRVPGLVRWPGHIPASSVCETPVIGSDVFPTLLTAAGMKVPESVTLDGVNVLEVLKGRSSTMERVQPLFWRLLMAPNMKMAMRVGDWKILADEAMQKFELYDLKNDPKETQDRQSQEVARFAQMRTQLMQHVAAVDSEGPDWWKRLSPNGGADPAKQANKKKKARN
jgi:arylsulfatase A